MFELTPYARKNHLNAYNPFREMEDMEREFFGSGELTAFKTDIKDVGDAYQLEADLPGFKKEDIHAQVDGDTLTINAERHSEWEKDDKKSGYSHMERSYGKFSRSFDISAVKADAISASYTDGVLKLVMPKKDETTPTSRRLEIQ